ncbi:MAG: DsbA family protein [Patescibacteria group bacterium]
MENQHAPRANPWMISTLVLAGIVVGYGVAQIPGLGQKQQASVVQPAAPAPQVAQQAPPPPVLTAEQVASLPDDDAVLGKTDAPITLVEFSDFQCPYCSRFFTTSLPAIEENYIKTGKVRLIYRDFPLDKHPQAQLTAEAAECAGDQGKYYEMHDMIFEEQDGWSGNPDAAKVMKDYARKIGLDAKKFATCLDSNAPAAEVRKDLIDGATAGVDGTPGFFVNGKLVSGAMPYEAVFKPIFDAELAGKKWVIQYDALGQPSVKVE